MVHDKEVITVRSIQSNRKRIDQIQSNLTEEADEDDNIIGRFGEVPRSDIVDAIVLAFLCADMNQEDIAEEFIEKLHDGIGEEEYEYELDSNDPNGWGIPEE